MIFDVYWENLLENYSPTWNSPQSDWINLKEDLAFLLQHTKDKYVVIVTKEQNHQFQTFLDKYNLRDCVEFEMKEMITNANYPDMGRRLKLAILAGKGEIYANQARM